MTNDLVITAQPHTPPLLRDYTTSIRNIALSTIPNCKVGLVNVSFK
jgi:hypothetical protein